MKTSFTAALVAAGLAACAHAGLACAQETEADAPFVPFAGAYAVDKQHATIHWSVSHRGLSNYIGRFDEFDIDLTFDADDPESATLTASIDPTSLNIDYSGASDFAAELYNDVMKAAEFPQITFTATGISVDGENAGTVTGDLAFAGQTHPVTLDVTYNGASPGRGGGSTIGFAATGTLTRSEWGADRFVQSGIGDDVSIRIEAEFRSVEAE